VSNHRSVHVHPHARVTARNARAQAPQVHMHASPTVTGSPSGRSGHRPGLTGARGLPMTEHQLAEAMARPRDDGA
jgi:hypothetical protein